MLQTVVFVSDVQESIGCQWLELHQEYKKGTKRINTPSSKPSGAELSLPPRLRSVDGDLQRLHQTSIVYTYLHYLMARRKNDYITLAWNMHLLVRDHHALTLLYKLILNITYMSHVYVHDLQLRPVHIQDPSMRQHFQFEVPRPKLLGLFPDRRGKRLPWGSRHCPRAAVSARKGEDMVMEVSTGRCSN